jgi:hypothetical protein
MAVPDRHRRRVATTAALPWAVWALVRVMGAERGFPLVPVVSFTPYAAASAVLPLALAVRTRSVAGGALSAAAGLALGSTVLSRAGGRPAPLPAGPRVRVASVSLRKGLVAADPVIDLVRRHDVDVLSVQELTPSAEAALRGAGIGKLLPSGHVIPARHGSIPSASGAVWTRLTVLDRASSPGGFEQPTVRLEVDGGPDLELTAVHSTPPVTPASVQAWHRDLTDLPHPDAGVLRVLAGDFNATVHHAALRGVLDRGYVDAARAVGRALAWTWRPLRLRFPRLAVDHVLVDPRIGVAQVELVPVAGSDHRAVVADLVLPAG